MDAKASGASKAGVPHEKIAAVLHFRESRLFTEAEKVALELAEAMTCTPPRVTDDLYRRVQERYANEEIVAMAAHVALENLRSRFNRCFDVQPIGTYPRLGELLAAAGIPTQEEGHVGG